MDLEAVQRDLVEWGLVERAQDGVAWSKRLRGAVMREAARLAQEERSGRAPQGRPLDNAIAGALASWPVPEGAKATPEHARFLAAVELAALPDSVRHTLGG